MTSELQAAISAICEPLGLVNECREIWHSPAAHFDKTCIESIRTAARQAGYPHLDIVSGAGHDAGYINRVAPTAMIFVPCARMASATTKSKRQRRLIWRPGAKS